MSLIDLGPLSQEGTLKLAEKRAFPISAFTCSSSLVRDRVQHAAALTAAADLSKMTTIVGPPNKEKSEQRHAERSYRR
jgi:hypothetical protein